MEVSFVDMRYGVRDESTLKHMTWEECERELKQCREESAGIFFLSLQGSKYGHMPLPRAIHKDQYEGYVFILATLQREEEYAC